MGIVGAGRGVFCSPVADASWLELLGGRDGHRVRRHAWRGTSLVNNRSAGSAVDILFRRARGFGSWVVGDYLAIAVDFVHGARGVFHCEARGEADSSGRRVVRVVFMLRVARVELRSGERASVCDGHLRFDGGDLFLDSLV